MDIDENAPGNQSQQAVTRTTDNETGHDPGRSEPQPPLPPDDEAPVDEDMADVDAANAVATDHPEPGSTGALGGAGKPHRNPERSGDVETPRGMPASDPESGA